MYKVTNKVLKKIATFLYLKSDKVLPKIIQQNIEPSIQSTRVIPWFRDNGDKTHRVNYELNEDSVVIDLGGYEGQWAADIFCKYTSNIHIFEPYKEFAKNIQERFKKNAKVIVYAYGLSNAGAIEKLNISADGSSTFKHGEQFADIELVKIDYFLDQHRISNIDLIKINIEGGEFDLLEYLIKSEKKLLFKNIQVQFHDFIPNAVARMHAIQNELSKTHYLTYQYEFVWENWKRKS